MNNFGKEKDGLFGLANFLLKRNFASNHNEAMVLAKKILIGFAVICFLIIIFNLIGGKEEIPEKYYYNPSLDTEPDYIAP